MTTNIAKNSTGASDAFYRLSILKFLPVNVTCDWEKRLGGSGWVRRSVTESQRKRLRGAGPRRRWIGERGNKKTLPAPTLTATPSLQPPSPDRELKQQRRRRLRKRHYKSEFALPQTLCAYSISFTSSHVGKCFWSWILKDSIKGQEKKKKTFLSCVAVLDRTWTLRSCSNGKEM